MPRAVPERPQRPRAAAPFDTPAASGKEQECPSRVRYRGGRDDDGEEASQRLQQERSFATFDIFAFSAAPLTPECGRLHPLAIEAASGGVLVASCLRASPGVRGIMEPLPGPAVTPWAAIPRDPIPCGYPWESIRHVLPLSTPEKRALTAAHLASSRWRPSGWGGGITSLIQCHAASGRSVGESCAVIPLV